MHTFIIGLLVIDGLFEHLLALQELNGNPLSANLALTVHQDKFFILVLEVGRYLDLVVLVNGRVILALDQFRNGDTVPVS